MGCQNPEDIPVLITMEVTVSMPPACLAEWLDCSMHLEPSCTTSMLSSFICAALLKSMLLLLVACAF